MKNLLNLVQDFNERRKWREKHTPLQLALSVAIEAGELLECFQWIPEQITMERVHSDHRLREAIGMEMADIFIYLMSLSNKCDIDLEKAVLDKLIKNENRYPVEKCCGNE